MRERVRRVERPQPAGSDHGRERQVRQDPDGAPRTERTYHVGSFEELLPHSGAEYTSVMRTRVSDAARHVRTAKPRTDDKGNRTTVVESHFEYVHKDHLGSAEAITDAAGKIVRALAHDPYGSRRKADWTAALTEAEIEDLADSPGPRERGHAGHEHLDRTGLIHRGGRVYDPTLGRFLSPDPLVADPASAQAWNGYSYVSNSPMSFVDPSGMIRAGLGCNIGPVMCLDGGGGGASSGGFGVEPVVSTYRYRYADVFVSTRIVPGWIHGGGNGPGALDGWWDFMDPFVEVFHRYVIREGIGQVTRHVPVVGTPNITGRDVDTHGVNPSVHIDKLIRLIQVIREMMRSNQRSHPKKEGKAKQTPRDPSMLPEPEGSIESVDDVFSNPSLLEGRSPEQVQSEIGNTPGWVEDVMHRSRTNPEGGWVFREVNQAGKYTGRRIQYHPGTWRHFGGNAYWKISGMPNQPPIRVLAAP